MTFTKPALACAVAVGILGAGAWGQCLPQFRTGLNEAAGNWQSVPGANGTVQSMVVGDPDGPGGPVPTSLIVGGTYSAIGNVRSSSVAYWNPTTGWVGMGRNNSSGENIFTLTTWNGSIIAGGLFGSMNPAEGNGSGGTQPTNVAMWVPTAGLGGVGAWVPLSATSISGGVQSLIVHAGSLYALNRSPFGATSALLYKYVPGATTSTGTWSPIATDVSGQPTGLVSYNGDLYITGNIYRNATSSVHFQVARLNAAGTDVIELPQMNGNSTAYGGVVFNNELYIFGSFVGGAGGLPAGATNVARYVPLINQWAAASSHPSATTAFVGISAVRSAIVHNNQLVCSTDTYTKPLATLDTNASPWVFPALTPGGSSTGTLIQTLCTIPDGSKIAIGASGSFNYFADTSATRLVFWTPASNTYTTVARGFGDTGLGYPIINDACQLGSELYIVGSFDGVGERRGKNIAVWNGSTLAPVPNALNAVPEWISPDGTGGLVMGGGITLLTRYVGGGLAGFSTLTDSDVNGYTSGIFGTKCAVYYNGQLVIGGQFSRASYPSNLARRTGTTWSSFGGVSPNNTVSALTTWSSPSIAGGAPLLVATGQFTTIGALSAKVAAWDGSTWRALGQASFAGSSGNPPVSLFSYNGDLHMAVYINGVNGSNNYPVIIRYNPATDLWVELPKPVPPVAGGFGVPARAVVSNGSIWLASTYLVPSTSTNTAVLRWNGSVWSTTNGLYGGFPQSYSLANYGNDVVLTGAFQSVGVVPAGQTIFTPGVFSSGWARLSTGGTLPSVVTNPIPTAVCSGTNASFSALGAGQPPLSYQWQTVDENGIGTNLVNGPLAGVATQITGATLPTLNLTGVNVAANRKRFRCIVSNDCGGVASVAERLFVDASDVGVDGGLPGRDGQRNNNDFIVFIDYFFAGDPRADLGRDGGVLGDDGVFNNNDFVVFIDRFFSGC